MVPYDQGKVIEPELEEASTTDNCRHVFIMPITKPLGSGGSSPSKREHHKKHMHVQGQLVSCK